MNVPWHAIEILDPIHHFDFLLSIALLTPSVMPTHAIPNITNAIAAYSANIVPKANNPSITISQIPFR